MENDVIVRGLAAIVKELQSIHGELTLTRQAAEKYCDMQKKTAEDVSKIENHIFVSNGMVSEIVESAKKTENSTFISQCELHRIAQKGKQNADR